VRFIADDGGRRAAGFKGRTNDCVVRSIAIATRAPYRLVYDEVIRLGRRYERCPSKERSHPRTGVCIVTTKHLLALWGWEWCYAVGGIRLRDLPRGRYVVSMQGHVTAVCDRTIRDTWNCEDHASGRVLGVFVRADLLW